MSTQNAPTTDLSALSGLAPELAEMLASAACDVVLVLDEAGIVRNIALGGGEPVAATAQGWLGRRWTETVTEDTRGKAEEFLADIARDGVSRPRQFNHESLAGTPIPISYSAVRLGERGPTLAIGRDLRVVSSMQQRLVQAQADMERDYWQRRQAETRYRLLFHVAAEPILIVDATSFSIIDANRAAGALLARAAENLRGTSLLDAVETSARGRTEHVLDTARGSGRVTEGTTALSLGRGRAALTVTPFQSDTSVVLLVRLRPVEDADANEAPTAHAAFAGLVQRAPDAVVITRTDGSVLLANGAFQRLLELGDGGLPAALKLGDCLGNAESPFDSILDTVRSVGFIRLLRTSLRGPGPRAQDVELSATLILDQDLVGFIIRVPNRRDTGPAVGSADASVH